MITSDYEDHVINPAVCNAPASPTISLSPLLSPLTPVNGRLTPTVASAARISLLTLLPADLTWVNADSPNHFPKFRPVKLAKKSAVAASITADKIEGRKKMIYVTSRRIRGVGAVEASREADFHRQSHPSWCKQSAP